MDRIALISDIHGNLPALQAVIDDIQNKSIDAIMCLGDIIGKGPSDNEVLCIVQQTCSVILIGNWELNILYGKKMKYRWHYEKLSQSTIEVIKTYAVFHEFYMSGKLIRVCHADPNDVFNRVYSNASIEEKKKLFAGTSSNALEADIVVYADTHIASSEQLDEKILINSGSVGNPMDFCEASYVVLEGDLQSSQPAAIDYRIVRIPYDIDKAIMDTKSIDLPNRQKYITELKTAVYHEEPL